MENELQYSNREIREFFKDIQSTLSRIEAQTVKTNGRVTAVENEIWNLKGWRRYVSGGLMVVTLMLPAAGVVAWYLFNQLQSVQASVAEINTTGRVTGGISSSQTK